MSFFSRQGLTALLAGILSTGISFAASASDTVGFSSGYRAGSIVIITHQRELYYVLGEGRAIRYPVGVGKAGMAWQGHARVKEKFLRPAWSPPEDIWRTNPAIPGVIPPGDPRNPMGAAAMGLDHGNYGIHGTNNPDSVGRFVSHGCIRMHNADIMDLYRRTPIGTDVFVLP